MFFKSAYSAYFSLLLCIFKHFIFVHFSFSHVFFQSFPIKKGEFILLNSPDTTLLFFCSFLFCPSLSDLTKRLHIGRGVL